MDNRLVQLCDTLINYSCELKPGEKVLIEIFGDERDFARQLVKQAYKAGAIPFVTLRDRSVMRDLLLGTSQQQLEIMAQVDSTLMKQMDAYIGVRGGDNVSELSDVPSQKMALYEKWYSDPVHSKIRVKQTRWVVLRCPTPSMAQMANTSIEAFEDFYYNVCNLDYNKMSLAMDQLVDLMDRTDRVHIKGEGTDLRFSIKDIPAIKCDGKLNVPDGEVFTAPIRDSIEGTISYNTPSIMRGFTFENLKFTFNKGKIVQFSSNNDAMLENILNSDEGARYVGEFAIGVNPYITKPMKDTLFDEKICGSIHLTPGKCYDEASNGNDSTIHWDLVYIQTPQWGGGEIYFDDVLVRKDGLFVLPELECLNPQQLMN